MSVGTSLRTPQSKCPTVGGRADGGLMPYVQVFNPRNSMSITNTKGLLNMPGQNNCFLNSAVQVLWHLDIFRRSFRELSGHACMEDSCIFCALKELFAQFQYSQESALPPDALRRALAETFCDQRRFQLGFMDDAAECFENILMRIHFHIANNESEDMCSASHCIPHQRFAMTLVEQTVCHACGATSEPLPFTQMVHYVPTSALCSQAKLMKDNSESFSELLKRAGGLGDLRDCPSSCGAVIQIRKTLMNRPEIVSVGLVWDSERPTLEHIMDVFNTIGMSLKLQDVFHSVVDNRWASSAVHQLVGIVTYYGKHYSTFFFHTKLRVWIYFDDAAVREIGPKWEQVVEKCCKGHFQPLLLLYTNPSGIPVNTSTAPRLVTVVPGHKKGVNGNNKCCGRLDLDKQKINKHFNLSPQRRAVTPNPEVSSDINAHLQPRRAVTPNGELTWWDETNEENKNRTTINTRLQDRDYIKPLLQDPSSSQACQKLLNPTVAKHPETKLSYSQLPLKKPTINMEDITLCPSEETTTYISREAVENVLQLQRQRSIHMKRNSSSSLESLDNVFSVRDKGLPAYLKYDAARRRDSGNWSGDRNSASSSSTTSLDNPYFYVVGNKRFPTGIRNGGRPGESISVTDPGYDSFSLSSSDSYPSAINSSGKLGQILENVQTAFAPYDISQLQYCLKDIRSNEKFPIGFKDECDKLCAEADIFVAKSIERENVGDISMAALLSDTAAARARAAMDVPYTSTQALAMAKMKHSMCLIRSSNLHKKLKEAEVALRRKQKESFETSHKEPTDTTKIILDHLQNNANESTEENGSKHPKKCLKKTEAEHSGSEKNVEIYATFPKRTLKKKGALSSFVESLTGEESSEEKTNEDKTQNKDSDLSDYSSEWEHTKKSSLYRTYSGPNSKTDPPTKKQHRIRRKLMGGFMKRKNRSLPDLREGQDSGGESSRSFDDCFFSQASVACRKEEKMATSPQKRAQTPPPYKPPPPIPHNTTPLSSASPKQRFHPGMKSPISNAPPRPKTLHPPVFSKEHTKHTSHTMQRSEPPHSDFRTACPGKAVWLQELQKKQEEINLRRKQQEDGEKRNTHTNADTKIVGPYKKMDCRRDVFSCQQHLNAEKIHHCTQSLPKCLHPKENLSRHDRDLPPPKQPPGGHSSAHKFPDGLDSSSESTAFRNPQRHLTAVNCDPMPSYSSGSVYNPHLTDAQLTNVLRIAASRSSIRNSSTDDEMRRPDKPPDYETALQRRDLLRHELYATNNFDFLLAAKKRSKKSVTFSDKVVLVACAGDEDNDFIPNPLLERVYKQHLMQKPASKMYSSEVAVNIPQEPKQMEQNACTSSCNLCHKKPVETPKSYCPDCTYYMSRFQQK